MKPEESKRDYTEGIEEILQSSFIVRGIEMNIFKIKLCGKPTPSEIDKIFDFFKARPALYISSHEILLKSLSEDLCRRLERLKRRARKEVRLFVEEVRLLHPEEKMTSKLADIVFQKKDFPEKSRLIVFLVPGFKETEIQDLQEQISLLISEPKSLEIVDMDNGILLSSATAEDTRSLAEKPYIFHISKDIEPQSLEETVPLKTAPDIVPPKDNDPAVCVVDTGVDPETLGSALVECSHEDDLPDGIDTIGHGTCVSSAAVWGQDMFSEKNQVIGRCRIVSHKL